LDDKADVNSVESSLDSLDHFIFPSAEQGFENTEVILDDKADVKSVNSVFCDSVESVESKQFEDMNEEELRNEFAKRNMNVGRISKKDTFIAKLNKYESQNK
jgi:hypothetical protein